MRVFVAAELPDHLMETLCETQALLRSSVRGRYVAPDQFHATLAFLGEVSAHEFELASSAVGAALLDADPVEVSLGALGAFGRARKATLWQTLEGEGLPKLAGVVREALDVAGVGYDTREFQGHVTLMRGADLSSGQLPPAQLGEGVVETVCLYRSHLNGDGATYETLERIACGVGR